jgi:hypothetical protein
MILYVRRHHFEFYPVGGTSKKEYLLLAAFSARATQLREETDNADWWCHKPQGMPRKVP